MRLSLLHKLEDAHDDSVWTVSWTPSSNIIVTGSVDESVKLWQQSGDTLQYMHKLVRGTPSYSDTKACKVLHCATA
jgi:WD40 repeat protein